MEDILETYALSYDSKIPLVCMDEKPCYFIVNTQESIPMSDSHPLLEDYSYKCEGSVVSLCLLSLWKLEAC
jgi:hypothetical protein